MASSSSSSVQTQTTGAAMHAAAAAETAAPSRAHQMEVAMDASPAITSSSSATGHDSPQPQHNEGHNDHTRPRARFLEQQLIPPTSRLSRLPPAVPLQPTLSSHPPAAAIQSQSNTLPNYPGQDVHLFVNNSASRAPQSTVTRPFGQPQRLETSVSSSTQPLTQHVINHPIRRPRTSTTIFKSPTDLAAHYGIPQLLPPAPSTRTTTTKSTYHHQPTRQQLSSAIPDFQTLSANYLNMLNNKKPAEPSTTATASTAMVSAPTQQEPSAPPMIPSDVVSNQNYQDLFGMSTAPATSSAAVEMTHADRDSSPSPTSDQSLFDFSDLTDLTSPLIGGGLDYSPGDTPYSEFLETPNLFDQNDTSPLWGDEPMLTSPMMGWTDDSRPLFGGIPEDDLAVQQQKAPEASVVTAGGTAIAPANTVFDNLYTISPETPALQSFHDFSAPHHPVPTQLLTAVNAAPAPVAAAASAHKPSPSSAGSQRRSKPTGIRKGVTPDSLLDVDAPTQPRKYVTPSATSKKEVPAVFARKRARSTAFGDDEDELAAEDLPLNATEAEIIAAKRRQNTVAARKSRRRKLEQFQRMEREILYERRQKEIWTERANSLLGMLRQFPEFANYPEFAPDEPLVHPASED